VTPAATPVYATPATTAVAVPATSGASAFYVFFSEPMPTMLLVRSHRHVNKQPP